MDVNCTQCGGHVPVELDQGLATCPYCGSALYVSVKDGFLHYMVAPVLKEADLGRTLATFLERKERRGGLEVIESHRVFWPYWQVQEAGRMRTFIASTHPITALEDAGIPSGDAKPFIAAKMEREIVEEPTEALEDLMEREGIGPSKVRLVHLPFWVVNYEYDGVRYEAWVDAVRGDVYADELPPTFAKEKDRLYAIAAFVLFAVFFLIGVLVPNGNHAFLAYIGASFPLYFAVHRMLREVMS